MTSAIPTNRTLNTVTPEEWRAAGSEERWAFINHWRREGYVAFCCINCSYPTYRGVLRCEACDGGNTG